MSQEQTHLDILKSMHTRILELRDACRLEQFPNTSPRFWSASEDFSTARNVMNAALGSISEQTTKLSLLTPKKPNLDELKSIIQVVIDPCEKLRDALTVAVFSGAGRTLSLQMSDAIRNLFVALGELLSAAANQQWENLPSLTGVVWEQCEKAKKAPTSNQIAVKRSMLQCMILLKDFARELDALLDEQDNSKTIGATYLEDSDELIEELDTSLTPEEITLLTNASHIFKMTWELCRMSARGLTDLSEEDAIEAEELSTSCSTIHDLVFEHGILIYPPIDPVALCSLVERVVESALRITATDARMLGRLKNLSEMAELSSKLRESFQDFKSMTHLM